MRVALAVPAGPAGQAGPAVTRIWGVVAVVVALHFVALWYSRGVSASRYAAPPVAAMAVRWVPSPETADSRPSATLDGQHEPAPAAPGLSAQRTVAVDPRAGNKPGAETKSVVPVKRSPSPETARRGDTGAEAAAAPTPSGPPAQTALPAAPEYAFGIRLDPGPKPLDEIDPDYPDPYLREGTVVLRLLISDTGHVDNVAVVSAEPRGVFEQSALDAFGKARFAPGLAAGVPVKSQITVEVQFMPINRGARVSGRTY